VDIFDITGRLVANLVDKYLNSGSYQTTWNAKDYASGMYFCQLTANDYIETKKMIVLH